jgi:L-aspartate oxidase
VAGLRAAIELAPAGNILVLTKDELRESSSEYAQGGIAAALAEDDEVRLHEQDTMLAGDGLCDRAAVRTLVEEGPRVIEELIEWGAAFDRDGEDHLHFSREGAHSRSRILHAHGDSTGREIARTLYWKAATMPNVEFRRFAAMTDLLIDGDGVVAGVAVFDQSAQELIPIHARGVLLATGGLGRVFLETTNPDVATGDGVAAAYRAGAELADLEFVQFHPTALFVEGAPRFLLSEALRGEGAYLRNHAGERFMEHYHPMGELAPRDVVARSIVMEMRSSGKPIYLDLTHWPSDRIATRFPRIYETARKYGVDLGRQFAPVFPAAHYAMGGVLTDLDGRATLDRLFAAGEAACTGVHGANRLASNSLLEGVVFGRRVGRVMRDLPDRRNNTASPAPFSFPNASEIDLRRLAWEHCGLVRSAAGLTETLSKLEGIGHGVRTGLSRRDFEARSIADVLKLIAACALAREESRGGHYRSDFPEKSDCFRAHSVISRFHGVEFRPEI